MCIQVLRTDSSKGIPFSGLDVAASKGYFCSVQQSAEVGARSLVAWSGRSVSSVVELSILPSLLQVFMLERDAL